MEEKGPKQKARKPHSDNKGGVILIPAEAGQESFQNEGALGMKKVFMAMMLLVLCLGLWNCATIVSTTSQKIQLNSNPAGANVSIQSQGGGEASSVTTPAKVSLKRKSEYDLTFEKEGYQPEKATIEQNFNPLFLGNLLIGGLIGMVVDLFSGAVFKLDPAKVEVQMKPVPSPSSSPGSEGRDGETLSPVSLAPGPRVKSHPGS
jgi:hypothetical protein